MGTIRFKFMAVLWIRDSIVVVEGQLADNPSANQMLMILNDSFPIRILLEFSDISGFRKILFEHHHGPSFQTQMTTGSTMITGSMVF